MTCAARVAGDERVRDLERVPYGAVSVRLSDA